MTPNTMTSNTFLSLLEKVESLVFGFAMRLTRNREDAKDLMQETIMRCYGNRHKFQLGTNFKSWMTTIMYNSFVNHYRRKKTKRNVIQSVVNYSELVESTGKKNNFHANFAAKEIQSRIKGLPDIVQVPFIMFYKGYRYKEISSHLKIPIGTVKSRIFYARKQLKEAIQKLYEAA